jgi:hypothetical protein
VNQRGEGMARVHSRDSGTSFVEIVVSVVILGTVCIGVLNAIATAAVGARIHREVSSSQAWIATFADEMVAIESQYRPCTLTYDTVLAAYQQEANAIKASLSTDATITVTAVRFWDERTLTFTTSCRLAQGYRLQEVSIAITQPGTTTFVTTLVKRPPPSDIPTTGTVPASGGVDPSTIVLAPTPGMVT